jgi:2',3'-cyclic-nucleotide 2'-phosphodiesterase (5'-nucleotidase family)
MGSPRLGGLAYRATFTRALRQTYPEMAVLQLDAGRSMGEVTDATGRELDDLALENEAVLEALSLVGYDAANLTVHDAVYLSRYFAPGAASRPAALERFVSANLEPSRAGLAAPAPYVVRTLEGTRLPGGALRIAVAGVTEPNRQAETASGYRVIDPARALAATLPRARAEADLVVVLAYMSASQAEGLRARLGSLADVVVVANSLGEPPAATLESPVALYSWYKTQMLGELRARIENGRLVAPEQRFVRMDEPLSRDPDVEALVERSSSEVRRARERRFAGG